MKTINTILILLLCSTLNAQNDFDIYVTKIYDTVILDSIERYQMPIEPFSFNSEAYIQNSQINFNIGMSYSFSEIASTNKKIQGIDFHLSFYRFVLAKAKHYLDYFILSAKRKNYSDIMKYLLNTDTEKVIEKEQYYKEIYILHKETELYLQRISEELDFMISFDPDFNIYFSGKELVKDVEGRQLDLFDVERWTKDKKVELAHSSYSLIDFILPTVALNTGCTYDIITGKITTRIAPNIQLPNIGVDIGYSADITYENNWAVNEGYYIRIDIARLLQNEKKEEIRDMNISGLTEYELLLIEQSLWVERINLELSKIDYYEKNMYGDLQSTKKYCDSINNVLYQIYIYMKTKMYSLISMKFKEKLTTE
jgi:hypothetical protein